MTTHVEYTFTFDKEDEARFKTIRDRLDPDEYVIKKEIELVPDTRAGYKPSEMTTVIEMDPEAASTFRFGLRKCSIRRPRSEEELAQEKEENDRHKVTITVHMPQAPGGAGVV